MTSASYHVPVLLEKSVELMLTDKSGIYADGTLGAGGHTRHLLGRLDEGARVFGIDHDDEALAEAASSIKDDRFEAVKGNFGYLATLLPPETHGRVSGILLDLGVSSHQIDAPERGFSFREDGPLDMRMSNLRAKTAHQVVNEYEYEPLRDLLYSYGEERRSPQIAREIIKRRPLNSTHELKACVEQVVRGPHQVKSIARVFQAVRIEVNQELEMLKAGLEQAAHVLEEGGRLVVISYHSLEDRLVKYFMKSGNFKGKIEKDFYGNSVRPLKPLYGKPLTADESERSANPRSRSAKLRAAEKLGKVDA